MTLGKLIEAVAWEGPGEKPHLYFPDYMAMGDCRICGHVRDAHDDEKARAILRALEADP